MSLVKTSAVLLMGTAMLIACSGEEGGRSNESVPSENRVRTESITGPFARAEASMNSKMMAAVGINPGDTWTAKMIEHHAGAVEMSRIALAQNAGPEVAKLAQHTIDKQTKEIAGLRELRQQGLPDLATSELYQAAMMRMHQAMMAATGANIDETYLLKMLEHHRGAVTMSDVALANDLPRQLRSTIQKTRADQTEEIAIIEAMLRGAPLDQAMRQPAAKPAQKDTDVSTASKTSTDTKPASRSESTSAKSQPEATKSSGSPAAQSTSASCAPEHRELGHC